jgi:hypothetical protein
VPELGFLPKGTVLGEEVKELKLGAGDSWADELDSELEVNAALEALMASSSEGTCSREDALALKQHACAEQMEKCGRLMVEAAICKGTTLSEEVKKMEVAAATAYLKAADATAERLGAKLLQIEVNLLETEDLEVQALAIVKKLTDEKFAGTNAQPASEIESLRSLASQAKAAMETASQVLADLQLRTAEATEAAGEARKCAEDTERRLQATGAAAQTCDQHAENASWRDNFREESLHTKVTDDQHAENSNWRDNFGEESLHTKVRFDGAGRQVMENNGKKNDKAQSKALRRQSRVSSDTRALCQEVQAEVRAHHLGEEVRGKRHVGEGRRSRPTGYRP